MTQKNNSALVLSGGAALGAAHIGVLKVMESRNYSFNFFAGVSAGALICALSACGKRSGEIQEILEEVNFFSLAFDFIKSPYALLRGDKVKTLLERILGNKYIQELPVPLLIGATDFSTGQRVILRRGRLSDALRASISVPVVFEPFFHPEEKRWLVDGGLTQNFPLDLAVEEYKGQVIIGVDVTASVLKPIDFTHNNSTSKTKNITAIGQRAVHILLSAQQRSLPEDPRVRKIIPDLTGFTVMDVFKLGDIIAAGERAAENI